MARPARVHRRALVLALALAVLLAACQAIPTPVPPTATTAPAAPAPTAATGAATVEVRDDVGRTVKVPAAPRRIVSVAPSNTEMVYLLGLESRLVGVDESSDFPAAATQRPKIGQYFKPSLEKIVELNPDLVLATGLHEKTLVPDLEKRGIPTLVLAAKDLPGVVENVRLLARLGDSPTGAGAADALGARMKKVQDAVAGATEKPRVFVEISPDLYTAGPGSFIHDILARAGATNVAESTGMAFPQLNAEAVVKANPQFILLVDGPAGVTPDSVKARAGWSAIDAVARGRVILLDPDVASRPGPRAFDALEQVAKIVHPDRIR